MKKLILLISFCCFGFIIQAQEFLIDSLHFHGDTAIIVGVTERRIIENHDLLLRYVSADHGKRFAQNEELRKRWLKQIKNKVLTKELKYNLKDSSILADRRFWIDVYFDKEGDVFTVVFEMEKCIYNLLPEKWVKETFNFLMKEKINTTEFWDSFSSRPDALAEMRFSVRDFFLGKIRDQKQLETNSTKDPQD